MAEETPKLYLTDVHLKGYKSIKDTKATFNEGINILIGPNGSGKTNFLEFLESAMIKKISRDIPECKILLRFTVKTEIKEYALGFNIDYELDNEYLSRDNEDYTLVNAAMLEVDGSIILSLEKQVVSDYDFINIIASDKNASKIVNEIFTIEGSDIALLPLKNEHVRYLKYSLTDTYSELSNPSTLTFLKGRTERYYLRQVQPWNPLIFFIQHLSITTEESTLNDTMLAEYIQNVLANTYFDEIREAMSRYSPVQDVRISKYLHLKKDADKIEVNFLIFEFKIEGKWFLWKQLSDGTRRAFSIVMSILQAEIGPVLLEEPELGLYPDQLQKLLTFIKEQSSRLQFIITTHSPDVLDILGIDELDKINICEMKGEEGTKIRKMTEEERKGAEVYYKNTGFLSDYWKHKNLGIK